MKYLTLLLVCIPTLAFTQLSKKDSIWLPMQVFIGTWTGVGESDSGTGMYARSYQHVLNSNYIEVKNKSTYPPSAQNPKGEVHEDIGYISYDKSRKKFALRQFHIEGFVNTYYLESISPDGNTLVFVTEAIENIPPGWRGRETYHIRDDNTIEETFELAEPGGDFFQYSKVTLNRQ